MNTVSEERGAQSIHRALTVLEAFSVACPSLSLTEISDYAGLTVPTTHRMVRALISRGYIVHSPLTRRYSLGSSVMKLAQVLSQRADQDHLLALALPHMEELREVTGETVGLQTRVGNERVCVAELVSHHVVRMETGVGRVFPLHAGSAGKALLAHLEPQECDQIVQHGALQPVTPNTIVDQTQLKEELVEVRANGYAVSIGESVPGASGLAVPLFGPSGLVAAINVAGPANRWTREAMTDSIPRLLETAALISAHLGHLGGLSTQGEGS